MRSRSRASLVLTILFFLSIVERFAYMCGGVRSPIPQYFRGNRNLNNDAISGSLTPTTARTKDASTADTGEALTYIGTITGNMLVSSPQMPIPFTLKTFGAAEIDGYSTCADLRNDLQNAASFLVSLTILQNLEYDNITYYGNGTVAPSIFENEAAMPHETRAMSATLQKAGRKTAKGGRTNSYNTNNQVDGIDEADLVITDGVNVFTGYGNAVVLWDAASGVELSRTVIFDPATPATASPGAGDAPIDYFPESTLQVRSLFLNRNRLVVIVDGYSSFMSEDSYQTIIPFNGSTRVRFLDITNIPRDGSELRFLTEEILPGNYFQDAYFIDNYLHCVVGSYLDTYPHLARFFDHWTQEYANLNSTEYVAAAVAASEKVISSFVAKLMSELVVGNSCENISQLAIFPEGIYSDGRSVTISEAADAGVLNGFVYVTTLNTQFDPTTQDKVQLATAGIMTPSPFGVMTHANDGYLFLVSQRSYTSEHGRYESVVYVVACTLSATGESATIQSVGTVPGYFQNQLWLDYHQRHLRVATTISANWGCANIDSFESGPYYNFTDCDYQLLDEASNRITVLNVPLDRYNRLQQVGLIKLGSVDYASMSSVRFVQNKAFVLISELNSSSFYTVDMQDPTALDVSSTVDVTGYYYSQLQLIDTEGDFLFIIGPNGNYSGPQLVFFDATHLGGVLIQQYDVESGRADMSNGYISSDAEFDYKAFRWLSDVRKLILPLRRDKSYYNETDTNYYNSWTDSFMVFDVTTDQIELGFEISQEVTAQNSQVVCWNAVSLPARSLVIDGVVTTIKGSTVVATRLDNKEKVFVLNLDKDVSKTACLPYIS